MGTQTVNLEDAVGEVIGGCLLTELIGQGGMGAVYQATQVSLDRQVAVKVLKISDELDKDEMGALFMKEARLVARLNHPNVVQIFDAGRHCDLLYMVIEYVEGVTLKDLVNTQPRFSIDRLFRVARKVAFGLAAAHKANIVHRDIKPENILLTSYGQVKIADFGAAGFLLGEDEGHGALIGTPLYMAPEVITRQPYDGRADVYALGLILYMAAAGSHPFRRKDVREILQLQLQEEFEPLRDARPEVHPDFAALIEKLCSKRPHERLAAEEVVEVLEAHPEWERDFVERRASVKVASEPAAPVAAAPRDDSTGVRSEEKTALVEEEKRVAAPPVAETAPEPAAEAKPSGVKRSVLDAPLVRERGGVAEVNADSPTRRLASSASKRGAARADAAASAAVSASVSGPRQPSNAKVSELCIQARFQLMKKRWERAEELFRKALELDPESEVALLGLARLLTEQKRFDDAVTILEKTMARGNVATKTILESPHFTELRECKAFRKLMAAHSL